MNGSVTSRRPETLISKQYPPREKRRDFPGAGKVLSYDFKRMVSPHQSRAT